MSASKSNNKSDLNTKKNSGKTFAGVKSTAKPTHSEINELVAKFNHGHLGESEKLALKLTQKYPTDGFGWKVLGALYQDQNLLEKASVALKSAAAYSPKDSEAQYNLGNYYYDQQLLSEAVDCYKKAVELNSSFAQAYYNLGSVLKELGLLAEAEASYQQALKINPKHTETYISLAQMLYEQGRYEEAIKHYQQVIRVQADFVSAYVNIGACYKALGNLQDAIVSYQKAIEIQPDHADALNNLGVALKELGNIIKAEECYRKVIAINPEYVPAYNNLGILLKDSGRKVEAESYYMKALEIDPLRAVTYSNLAVLLRELGRFVDAEVCCRNALKITPNYVDAYNNLGLALDSQSRFIEAVGAFEQSLELDPNNISALSNFSVTLNTIGQLTRAEAYLKRALALSPQFINAHINLCVNYLAQGRIKEAEKVCVQALKIQPDNVDAQSNLLFSMNYSADYSVEDCLEKARQYGIGISAKVEAPFTSWLHEPTAEKLRVGLVSGDLRQHVVAYFLENFVKHVDVSSIELIAYSTSNQEDEVTANLKPYFSGWKSLVGLNDSEAAALIHNDGLHVLLDLSGHSSGTRLPIFAWKAAPLQVSWLGYFATTGLTAMDYFIADEVGVPESNRSQFVEKIKYLPDTRLCFTAPDTEVSVSALPALNNQLITFGCFQNMAKVSDEVLDLWAEVLIAVPNSRLRWQYKSFSDAAVAKDLKNRLEKRGIEANRVNLLGAVTREAYLAAHHEVDVILDTFPFNGGTTTCEALWMGVPTLTLAGDRLIARQGASLLTAAGLSDWVAESQSEYINKAKAFCGDLSQLANLRSSLRAQVLASPLFDAQCFAKNMEKALWEMWAESQGLECKFGKNQLVTDSEHDKNPKQPIKLDVEVVSATRYSETDFWAKSALGLSLKRHLKQDARLSAHISFENTRGLSEVFNDRIEQPDKDATLIFIHDDVWIDEANFADSVHKGLEKFDVIGIAGNKRKLPNQPAWAFVDLNFTWDDKANLSGQVAHSKNAFGTVEVFGEAPAACELLDGVFLAAKKSSLIEAKVKFDHQFDFHFYDLDFCRTARQAGLTLGTWLIKLTHQSAGAFGTPQWREKHQKYINKWEAPQLDTAMTNNTVANDVGIQVNQELQQVINEVLEMAVKHQDAGQIEQAEMLYLEILGIQANHADANHHLGVIETHLKGAQAALPRFEIAVQAQPDNEQYWVSYIDAIMQSSPIEAAISALELGQKYGLRAETAQMLAADYMQTYEDNLRLSKEAPATVTKKILNLKIQHELKETS
ncbi:MAG: tetratricopeptide repeat protein [Methylotenera sp.]|uniref:tetratricopeptide repeat protein n=1 Tax=Methylotenera sp. TaxID=2051956 RepID=UPI0024883B6F|nr:tetratricopeptide repeat protein [Methylotenera sp.]MDI1308080.1 tetratricopeptide repeat protein [Methylotenera sp.]